MSRKDEPLFLKRDEPMTVTATTPDTEERPRTEAGRALDDNPGPFELCDHPFAFLHGHGNWPKELFIGRDSLRDGMARRTVTP